jgi:hypothetical protein
MTALPRIIAKIWRRPCMSDDFKQELREAANGLLLQIVSGKISVEDAKRELDICRAFIELVEIATDMGLWPRSPGEQMWREAILIEKWPAVCRRAGIGAIPMPDDIMRRIKSFGVWLD